MMWLLSFLASNWFHVLLAILALVVCAAVAWFFRNWKAVVAAVLIGAVLIGASVIDKRAYDRRSAEVIAETRRIAEQRLKIIEQLQEDDRVQRDRDAAEIERLQKIIDGMPEDNSPCGDDNSFNDIRNIR